MKKFLKDFILDTFVLIVGGVAFAAGLCIFAAPAHILTGGASGLAIVANGLWGLPMGAVIFALNVPLIIASFAVCGRRYTVRTLYAVVMFSAVIDVFEFLVPYQYDGEPLLCAIYGGLLTGLGMYIIMTRSIVTGGSDLLAYIIQRRHPGRSMGALLMAIDGAVVLIGALYYKSVDTALYSMALIILLTLTLDALLRGRTQDSMLLILTDKQAEVREFIDKELERGCTVLSGRGGYKGDPRDVIMCAVSLRQSHLLRRRVFEIDENAFIVIAGADHVYGNGFARPSGEEIY